MFMVDWPNVTIDFFFFKSGTPCMVTQTCNRSSTDAKAGGWQVGLCLQTKKINIRHGH